MFLPTLTNSLQVNTLKIRSTLGGGSKLEKDRMLLQLTGWEL